jgi:ABC-2 type transport system permease protein
MSTELSTTPDPIAHSHGAPSPTSDGTRWLSQARAFTERYLRVLARNRAVLFWAFGFPVGFYLLTIELFVDLNALPADAVGPTKAVVAVGYGVFGALIVCVTAFAEHLVEDLEAGRYDQFRSLPIAPSADLCGRFAAGYLVSLASFAVVLGVGVLTGSALSLRSPLSLPVVLLVFAGFSISWMMVAVLVAVAVNDERYASIVAVSVAVVSYFVTGFNGTQPAAFAGDPALLDVLPNTLAARVLILHLVDVENWAQAGLAPPGAPTGPIPLALLGAYGIFAGVLAIVVLRTVVYDRGVMP